MRRYKTVRLETRVYERLKKHKARGETFSELLDRLLDIYELLLAAASDRQYLGYAESHFLLYLN